MGYMVLPKPVGLNPIYIYIYIYIIFGRGPCIRYDGEIFLELLTGAKTKKSNCYDYKKKKRAGTS
jgi:hypothetical protein